MSEGQKPGPSSVCVWTDIRMKWWLLTNLVCAIHTDTFVIVLPICRSTSPPSSSLPEHLISDSRSLSHLSPVTYQEHPCSFLLQPWLVYQLRGRNNIPVKVGFFFYFCFWPGIHTYVLAMSTPSPLEKHRTVVEVDFFLSLWEPAT